MIPMKTQRKGQSAIEYLSTYGWALLAIVVVGAVLLQMGVFDQCSTSSPMFTGQSFDLEDWAFVGEDEITMQFVAIDNDVEITEIELDIDGEDSIVEDFSEDPIEVPVGESETATLTHDLASGTCASGSLEVTFNAGEIEGQRAIGDGSLRGRAP